MATTKNILQLSPAEAKDQFMKGPSYFSSDFPEYISFEPILKQIDVVLGGQSYLGVKKENPEKYQGVNYRLITNKDGRLAWRPFELIHPVIYVSLVDVLCEPSAWAEIKDRFSQFQSNMLTCCSMPMVSTSNLSDKAVQIQSWWQTVEQESLIYSFDFDHMLHTDVSDCYGSLYTHSIAWALHGQDLAKAKNNSNLLGNKIDNIIRAGRYGQTNGISQGSVLMDFIAEIVLGYVDSLIIKDLNDASDIRILRYRDDYRIFSNNDWRSEQVLKIISEKLRLVGMRLGSTKTVATRNVIEGSLKADKLAWISSFDVAHGHQKNLQKQLIQIHAFGLRFPNSGTLRRLVSDLHKRVVTLKRPPRDLEVQVAIATDIAVVSPGAFPAVAGILSHLISMTSQDEKERLWLKVLTKMKKMPHNGYLEIWLQRVTKPSKVNIDFASDEPICRVVNGQKAMLWNNQWISSPGLIKSLDVSNIIVKDAKESSEVIKPAEIALFRNYPFG